MQRVLRSAGFILGVIFATGVIPGCGEPEAVAPNPPKKASSQTSGPSGAAPTQTTPGAIAAGTTGGSLAAPIPGGGGGTSIVGGIAIDDVKAPAAAATPSATPKKP